MKFDDKLLKDFKKDFENEMKYLEKKYGISITLGRIVNDDSFFSARLTAEDAPENLDMDLPERVLASEVEEKIAAIKAELEAAKEAIATMPEPKTEPEPAQESETVASSEPIAEPESIPEPKKDKKKKKLDEMEDSDLESLDFENLDFSDIVVDEPKDEAKSDDLDINLDDLSFDDVKETPSKQDINDFDSLDLDDLSFDDVKQEPKEKPKSDDLDIDLDDLSFDDIKEEPKKESKSDDLDIDLDDLSFDDIKQEPKKESKSEDLDIDLNDLSFDDIKDDIKEEAKEDDLDIDLDDLSFDDVKEDFKELDLSFDDVKEPQNQESNDDLDDLDLDFEDEEDEDESEPTNIFEEMSRKSSHKHETTTYEDIDDLLSGGNQYVYSFMAKLIQGEGLVQDFYTDVKNELLRYKEVRSRLSWEDETFSYGSDVLAKVEVEGDFIKLYLAADPNEFRETRYTFKDMSSIKKYMYTPLMVTIRKYKDEQDVFDLIEEVMEMYAIEKGPQKYDDYHYEFETKEELIERGLIKKM